jgi:hypothetical protein
MSGWTCCPPAVVFVLNLIAVSLKSSHSDEFLQRSGSFYKFCPERIISFEIPPRGGEILPNENKG